MDGSEKTFTWCPKTESGDYWDLVGKLVASAIGIGKQNVIELVKTIPFPDKRSVFQIGDYGTADGAASMSFIRDLIVTLKELHGSEVQFQVIYEDQETNDFNALFKRLSGRIPDPPSYLPELDNVYPLASGIQFRKQCVPSNSMHFIMSNFAVQWLSKEPVKYKQSLYIYPRSSDDERKALYNQARVDWESFLLMRCEELKQGGILSVITLLTRNDVIGEESSFPYMIFMKIFTHAWMFLRDSEKIKEEEFINTNFPFCFYTKKQLTSPFEDISSPVFKSKLRLMSVNENIRECFGYSAWKKKKDLTGIDDRKGFAKNYIAAVRGLCRNVFMRGLSDSRTQQQKEDIVEEFFQMAEKKTAEIHPDEFSVDHPIIHLLIKKE